MARSVYDYRNPNFRCGGMSLLFFEVKTISTHQHAVLVALLIAERKAAGLRQGDLADRIGEHQSWVSRLESGQRRVDVVEFLLLARAIGFDPVKVIRRLEKVR